MTERLYIDGRDAYREYGVFIAEGGYNDLLSFPTLKTVGSNDWPEEDGAELDLSEPKLDSREVTLKFSSHGRIRVGLFIEHLSQGAYHRFEFKTLGRTYNLRLVSQPSLERCPPMETFSLRLADDFPVPEDYRYEAPGSQLAAQSGYELDGISLAAYGISLLRGSDDEIRKSPAVKKNLQQNLPNRHGALYDPQQVLYQTKDVKLSCLMRAASLEEFWRNYDALLHDLIRPAERLLYVDDTGYEYPCYYKNCSVRRFEPSERIWFEFDLSLTFTSSRVEGEICLLATERNEMILDEGKNAIQLV